MDFFNIAKSDTKNTAQIIKNCIPSRNHLVSNFKKYSFWGISFMKPYINFVNIKTINGD
jgi:hypothetical protein